MSYIHIKKKKVKLYHCLPQPMALPKVAWGVEDFNVANASLNLPFVNGRFTLNLTLSTLVAAA